ncbi:hypothetical protein XELAEV_18016865mg [Xenopus laevis]|uniref:Uncharacterized protein n=1 Tax=Xenopus laevis TaxID=8355 RepID=A0A974DA41_XENLA|nr:hypothetical protein XELAEV_18016865mg [Xenopus laevis]
MVTTSKIKKEQKQRDMFLGLKTPGMFPCAGCTQCQNVIKGKEFVHPGPGHTVQLRGHYSLNQFNFMVLEGISPLKYGVNHELRLKQREVW